MRVKLKIIGGPHKGKIVWLSGHETFLVGRSPRAHLRLSSKDKRISRFHFLIELNPPHCRLLDMNSRNGTYVNSERVEQVTLQHRDLIQAGRTVLRVKIEIEESDEAVASTHRLTKTKSAPQLALPKHLPAECPSCLSAPEPGSRSLDDPTTWLCAPCLHHAEKHFQFLEEYLIVKTIGTGFIGDVHLALRRKDGLLVAVKSIIPAVVSSPRAVHHFLREVDILQQLEHPNIVKFYESGEADERLYLIMEHVPGTDGGLLLEEEGPLEVDRAVRLTCQLLKGLEHAHEKGFVHRDVKPANVLVQETEEGEHVKIADFGLARTYRASQISGLTLTGDIGGTVPFVAPEQILNFRDAKPAADQFSAAATLYNLLTGHYVHDFPEGLRARLNRMLQEKPISILRRRRDVPRPLAKVIHQALSRKVENRFENVGEFRNALLEALGESER